MSQISLQVVVIGGGAAGFLAAITCAESHPHTQVTLLEAGRQPLSKVRVSGGGRCNVTHACFDPAVLVQNYPRGGKALRGAFSRFQPRDTVAWFAARGVQLKTESDGRMFPVSDDSATIVDCLMQTAKAAGVKLRTGVTVASVKEILPPSVPPPRGEDREEILFANGNKFEIELKSGEKLKCDRILLATGSNPTGYQIAKALGHHIEPPVPSLFTFNVPEPSLKDLAGVSVDNVRVRLQVGTSPPTPLRSTERGGNGEFEQTGPILITHWGLSGPAVLKLSAWGARVLHDCHYQATLLINWLPQYNPESLRQILLNVKSQLVRRQISTSCPVLLPRRLWEYLVTRVGISTEDKWSGISNKLLDRLIQELIQGQYQINGKGVFKEEFVTCGGVSLKEVDFKTMESKCCAGLYFSGEILDIDGVTGGFNFQSAWTTAHLAGNAIGVRE
ncbi:NAD(P)/FAD-dependent oxidoreductase [Argonema galeatum]|uniref:NAD(P)/FAD-dependent oxidoreductase n=1 Tax=Argonema galeatum TaxID=2942762 RepID=UPI00201376D9|nr:NAD(P)/FAD-dependent oxidoreductase [Argonema galeatum A003/A1]